MRLALIIVAQAFCLQCLAQTKLQDTKVSIELKNVSLESLISRLRAEYKLNVVYSVDRVIPNNKPFSITASDLNLRHFISLISEHFNLKFAFIGNYILLSQRVLSTKNIIQNLNSFSNADSKSTPPPDTTHSMPQTTLQISSVIKAPDKDSVVAIKAIDSNQPITTVTEVIPSPEKKKKRAVRSLSSSLAADFNQLNFVDLPDPNQSFSSHFSVAYNFSYSLSSPGKWRMGIGLTYSRKEFTYDRNIKILVIDDPVSIPNTTTLDLKYLEVPIEFGYVLFNFNGTSASITSGINSAFLVSKSETTVFATQGDPKSKYFIDACSSYLLGAQLGIRLSKEVYKQINIFCEPRYIKYFNPVNSSLMRSGADLFRLNAGFALRLNK